MNILIGTPLTPLQSGGPAQYADHFSRTFTEAGHTVTTISFSQVSQFPSGIRHLVLVWKMFRLMQQTDCALFLDTFSMALSGAVAAFISRTPYAVRVGGDFLWEGYINRTRDKIPLSKFYISKPRFSIKDRLIFFLQKYIVLKSATSIIFTTSWQKQIWNKPYNLKDKKSYIIENAYLPFADYNFNKEKTIDVVWIGRDIPLKNVDTLDRAVNFIQEKQTLNYRKFSEISHDRVIDILATARVLVIPSVSEVSPNLALEACALGVPVLLTNDCGFKELFPEHFIWIEATDPNNIAHNIEGVLNGSIKATKNTPFTRTHTEVASEYLKLLDTL